MLESFIALFAVASVLPLTADDVVQIPQPNLRIHHTNDFSWHTNQYAFGTLPAIRDSFDTGSGNNWHPDFFEIPIKDRSRMVRENVQWGNETNWVKAGLLLQYSPNTNRTDVAFFVLLHSSYTNNPPDEHHGYYSEGPHGTRIMFWLPPVEQRYQITLRDDNGNPVPKTKWGERFCKPIVNNFKRLDNYMGYQACDLFTYPPIIVIPSPLTLRDCFKITTAGKYHLEFEIRAMRETGQLPPYEEYNLPVKVEVEIKNP